MKEQPPKIEELKRMEYRKTTYVQPIPKTKKVELIRQKRTSPRLEKQSKNDDKNLKCSILLME